MKNKSLINLIAPLAVAAAAILMTSGCADTKVEGTPSTETNISLTHGNYKMVKAGAEGRSYGFRFLLGIIPITAPSTADARTDLYHSVGQDLNGRSVALVNVVEDHSTTWLILFSIPKIVITGDVVEFAQDNNGAAPIQPAATPMQSAVVQPTAQLK
jgi:hypothetical protein